jgi:hypothetical protein
MSFLDISGEKYRGDLVGTEYTLVHCSLYTRCIYRVLTPRELKNQVVNLQNIATGHGPGMREQQMLTAARIATDGFPYSSCRRESYIVRLRDDDCEPRSVSRSVATKAYPHNLR